MPSDARPLPVPDADSTEFWETRQGQALRLQRCLDCGTFRHYPRAYCPDCLSSETEWVAASGRGTVYSFAVVHRAFHPAFKDDVPYVVALIDLEEGPRMLSDLRDCPPEDAAIEMPVEVFFEDVPGSLSIPHFRPAKAS